MNDPTQLESVIEAEAQSPGEERIGGTVRVGLAQTSEKARTSGER
jgi:hypothetical protein